MAQASVAGKLDFKGQLHLHFVVMLTGFTAILGKLISLEALNLVFWRLVLSIFGFCGLVYLTNPKFRFQAKEFMRLFLPGMFLGLHFYLIYLSIKSSNASIALSTFAATSVFTSLLEPLMHKRSISSLEVFLGLVVFVGICIIFGFEYHQAFGIVAGLASALCYSLTTVINGLVSVNRDAKESMFYESIAAFLVVGVLFFFVEEEFVGVAEISLQDWGYLAFLSGVTTIYAYTALVNFLKRVTPFYISLAINLEPIYGLIFAALLFQEYQQLSTEFYFSSLMIVVAVAFYSVRKGRKPK